MEEKRKLPFGEVFQHNLLRLLITDEAFLAKASPSLKEDYFANKHLSWVYHQIDSHWKVEKCAPSFPFLYEMALRHELSEQQSYIDTINEIANSEGFTESQIRKDVTGFIQRNIFVDGFHQTVNLYNRERYTDAYDFMRQKIEELLSADFEKDEVVDWENVEKHLEEARRGTEKAVPTGITPIDKALGGGMGQGTLTVLLAPTNAGKSFFLVNVLYHAIMANKKIAYIVHEDEEIPTVLRALSRLTGIPKNKMFSSVLNEREKEKIKIAKQLLKKHVVMKFMYGSETTIEEVRDWLFLKKKEFNFDLAIDDYGQFIRTRVKTDGERFTQAIVHRTLKQIGLQLECAVLTVAQGNREATKVAKSGLDYLRGTDMAECYEIARVASNVVTMNRSDSQAAMNEVVFYLDKNRNGKKDIAVRCATDYDRCITHDPKLGIESLGLDVLRNGKMKDEVKVENLEPAPSKVVYE